MKLFPPNKDHQLNGSPIKAKGPFHQSGPAYIITQYFPEPIRSKIEIQVKVGVAN